ncbi:MAG TPA: glycoside hydrolase family 43 protein [Verrucomicrobiae bacterium]|nr:glycoside hydrolase family 43 protein [Verrucomicrobiae bacterium]
MHSILIFLLLLLPCCSTEYPKAVATYTNPVYAADMPDPSVKKFGSDYYAFGTTSDRRLPDGRIFTLLRSHDLAHWESLGGALVPPSSNPNYQYWAPEITEANDKYYLYYAMGDPGVEHFVVRVATCDQPQGPFVDSGAVLSDCDTNGFTIDPFPFRDDDGQWYLFNACDFPYDSPGYHAGTGIEVNRLLNMTTAGNDSHVVVRPAFDWTLYEAHRRMDVFHQTFAQWHTIEGPCVVKHDGKYYCFYSGANWQTPRYGVDYVVADHPLGPYTGAGDHARVLHSVPGKVFGPGGISIVTGPDGKTQYVIYHAWNRKMTERQMCVDKLEWTPDGPRCVPTVMSQVISP